MAAVKLQFWRLLPAAERVSLVSSRRPYGGSMSEQENEKSRLEAGATKNADLPAHAGAGIALVRSAAGEQSCNRHQHDCAYGGCCQAAPESKRHDSQL